ncbi:MAG: carboxypeptidase regulatory-like domain-containing protein [Comamonadaceae bacterium]|nr:MAG: carboxypeptidase regulatory-like domain-containing protein [Comamonadaceae bacterium]
MALLFSRKIAMRPSPVRAHASRFVLACACTVAAGLATAQVPPLRGDGAVRHVCGGIGSDESTAMRAAMKDHPLSLLFARTDGAYLAEVAVAVQRADGAPVLSLRASGPICLVDLPPGRYTVDATAEGVSKRQALTLGSTPQTADFRF